MEVFLCSSVCTMFFLNKITLIRGSLRQLWNRHPVLAIGVILTFPLLVVWLTLRNKRVKRDEESDIIGGDGNGQCNPTTLDVDKEFRVNSEVPSVSEIPVPACQPAHKRGADTNEDAKEILKRPKTEENDLTEDELYCEYDSTWEISSSREFKSSSNEIKPFGRPRRTNYKFDRFKNAARDMWNYRHDYPGKSSHRHWHQEPQMPNLAFYIGNIPSSPDGIFIGEFHWEWYGDYDKLEYVHTFIQWLFPLQEPGVNYQAKELTKEEIQAFCENPTAKRNLLESYKLMLDFYGIKLSNEKTGEVERASNWEERFDNLNRHTHNNLRISRILKCLGTLGYRHYQAPLVRFFLQETLVHGSLPNIKESLLNYYMFAVLDKTERKGLIKFAYLNYDPQEEFIWCPKKIQMSWPKQVRLPYSYKPNETKNKDEKADGTDDFWPSAEASPSMKEDKPLECEDEVGDEASEDLIQKPCITSNYNPGDPSLDPKNMMNSDTKPGITEKPDSEFESQGDKADTNDNATEESDKTVTDSVGESTTGQTMEGGHQVPLKKIHPSSATTDSNKQNIPAHSPSEEAVFGQECSLPREDLKRSAERNEKSTDMSSTEGNLRIQGDFEDMDVDEADKDFESRLPSANTKKKSCSRLGNVGEPSTDPEHQMNENTSLDVQKDLDSASPSPVGGDDQTTENRPDGDEEHMEIPQSQMNLDEESSSSKNTEEGRRNEEGDGDCDDDL